MGRLELRVSDEWLAALDAVRGAVPRGTFVKRAVALAVESSRPAPAGSPSEVTPRSQPTLYVLVQEVDYEGGTVLGVYSTKDDAHRAGEAYGPSPAYDLDAHPVTLDAPAEPHMHGVQKRNQ